METKEKLYLSAAEVAELLCISVGHAYKLIKRMNNELQDQGFYVIAGKVPVRYFRKRWFGFDS